MTLARIWAFDLDDAVTAEGAAGSIIDGGDGDDVIAAGRAVTFNRLLGGPGNDTLIGGPNVDYLDGEAGADVLAGGGGVDRASYQHRSAPVTVRLDDRANDGEAGEADNVRLDVEDVLGGAGPDWLSGSAAANFLWGGPGADVLAGQGGDDTLDGGGGPDFEHGGDGQDTFEQSSFTDRGDVFWGAAGTADRVSYASRFSPVVVDLDDAAEDGEPGEADNAHSDIEQVVGGRADDTLTGSAAANLLLGGPGNDTLDGLAGADTLIGDGGDDTLLGGVGNDVLTSVDGALGNDRLDGQADSNTCSLDRFDAWANCEALAVFP